MSQDNPTEHDDNILSFEKFQAPAHFRPCGAVEEYLDDPLEDLLKEFSECEESPPDASDFWSEQRQEELGIGEVLKEAQKQMSPIQRLRLSVMKTKKSLNELHYYNRELKIHLGL